MQIEPSEDLLSCIDVPDDAETKLRRALHISTDRPLRLAFLEGPGDIIGTYGHWIKGNHDPRVPIIAYSAMIYSLTARLNAQAFLLTETPVPADLPNGHATFHHLPRDRSKSGIKWHLSEMAYARRAAHVVNAWQPDVVIVHSDVPASIFRQLSGVRILSMHNTLWTQGQGMPRALKKRVLMQRRIANLRAIDAAICTSAECQRQLGQHIPDVHSLVFTPQVPLRAATRTSRATNRPLRNIVYLGRVEFSKGVLDLVEAFASVAQGYPDLHLHVIGSGGAEQAMQAAIRNANLSARSTLHGHCDSKKIYAVLSESDLLVCPTRSEFPEGLAVVPFEAALLGVPSLVSSAVPAAELLPRCTVAFPADDIDALAAALSKLLSNRELYSSLCAGTAGTRDLMLARGTSWGSQLYSAILLAATTHRINRYRPSAF